jgi:hypothetical protein
MGGSRVGSESGLAGGQNYEKKGRREGGLTEGWEH